MADLTRMILNVRWNFYIVASEMILTPFYNHGNC